MITNINYNHLYYFWVVSREGSIVNACKHLHLTPQTVSAQISLLEQRLGKKLFRREGRQLILTDFGRVTKEYTDDMFALAEEWLETSTGNHVDYVQRIKVGISDVLPKSLVARCLKPLLQHPNAIHLTCIDGSQPELLAQLAVHKLDIVLADMPADGNYHVKVYCHEIGKSDIALFAKKEWCEAFTQPFPQCIAEKQLLLPSKQSPLNRAIEYWLHVQQIPANIAGHIDDSALMKSLGQNGMGIFPAPTFVREELERTYDVRMLGIMDNVFQTYYLITPDRIVKDSIFDELVGYIQMNPQR